jgi:uncharacterized protein
MKKAVLLLFFLLFSGLASAASWPGPIGYVNDFAHVISAAQSQEMENLLTNLEKKTGIQIAVVTVATVEGADINGAAVDLFKAWGIGKKGKDNGILFLAAIEDHRARIEIGYGLEGAVTDGQAGEILRRDMIPLFKQGDYSQALTNGVHSILGLLEKSKGMDLGARQDSTQGNAPPDWAVFLILLAIVFVIVYLASQYDKKHPGRGGFYGGGWGSGGFGGGWGSGGGSGFGGFGGGSSGGGGASGSW